MKVSGKDISFVSIQFILFFIYTFDFFEVLEFSKELKTAGAVMVILGISIIITALFQLRRSLSPFPTPKNNGKLCTSGLYALVRHPIYTGIIISGLGYGLYQGSLTKLVVSILLFIVFDFKSRYEEELLINKYEDYPSYQSKTGRLLPKLF